MSMVESAQKNLHSPTLNTILMVEDTIKDSGKSLLTVANLKKLLPRKINHNTLKLILEYLEYSNKILVTIRGISWIHNTNLKLQRAMEKGLEL